MMTSLRERLGFLLDMDFTFGERSTFLLTLTTPQP
jgi:hypothetical protein